MAYKLLTAKAFTSSEYHVLGNPAGCVLCDTFPRPDEMSRIAKEAGFPMTAFVVSRHSTEENSEEYDVRYYDFGGRECHICGHATIVATSNLTRGGGHNKKFTFYLDEALFDTPDQKIIAFANAKEVTIELFSGKLIPVQDAELQKMLATAFRVPEQAIISIAFSTNIRDYVIEISDTATLESISPDFTALKELAEGERYSHEGLMLTTAVKDKNSPFDIHSRAFLPITGVNEDIACASANCSIIPYWAGRGLLPKNQDGKFRCLFPYPPGPEGYYGGVQTIAFDSARNLILVTAEATLMEEISVSLP
jgi:PhzF family phenazine biosynthesis protein